MASAWHELLVWVGILVWHLYLLLAKLGIIRPSNGPNQKMGGTMQLSKPFDPLPLIAAMKAAGIPDAEKLVNDQVAIVLDWVNSSVDLETQKIPLLSLAVPALKSLEQKALDALKEVETKIGS